MIANKSMDWGGLSNMKGVGIIERVMSIDITKLRVM